jgi:trimeric autotransporter adhesin
MKNILFIISLLLVMIQANAQTKEEIQKIRAASNIDELKSLSMKYKQMEELKKEKVKLFAQKNKLPIFRYRADGSFDQLMDVTEDGKLIYYTTSNMDAAYSTRTNHLNTGGSLGLNLDGQNMTAYVWDGGPVRTTHQEFGGRVVNNDLDYPYNGNSWHCTHVTGTIAAAGIVAAAKGMASQANVIAHNWDADLGEAA